jgi:hypothetical protein
LSLHRPVSKFGASVKVLSVSTIIVKDGTQIYRKVSVEFSTGGGEVSRCIGRLGLDRGLPMVCAFSIARPQLKQTNTD